MRKHIDQTKLYLDYDALCETDNARTSIICVSDRDIYALLSALEFLGWTSRWVDSNGDLLRNQPSRLADLELALTYVEDLRDNLMSNCYDGLHEIAAALAALANKPCCASPGQPGGAGSGGTGNTAAPPTDIVTGEPANHTGDPPDGFESWDDYDNYKCALAHWIADSVVASAQNISFYDLAAAAGIGGIASLLASSLLVPVAGEIVWAIAGLAVVAGGLGAFGSLFSDLYEGLSDVVDDLACAMYLGADLDSVVSGLQQIVTDVCDAQFAAGVNVVAAQIAMDMFSTDALNKLFTKDVSRTYPAADCDGCVEPQGCITGLGVNGGTDLGSVYPNDHTRRITVQLVVDGPVYRADVGVNAQVCGTINLDQVEEVAGSWVAYQGDQYAWYYLTSGGGVLQAESKGEIIVEGSRWVIYSTQALTVRLTFSNP